MKSLIVMGWLGRSPAENESPRSFKNKKATCVVYLVVKKIDVRSSNPVKVGVP